MDIFPKDPRQIRTRIRSYERSLRQEKKRFGFIHDGSGKRYLLGPLYLLMGDTAGALKSFAWFAKNFPDDSGDPLHLLCWTLVLYRSGDQEKATMKLRQTMLSNLYLLPRLLGDEQDEIDMWHGSNLAEKSYIDEFPDELFALWEPAAFQWADQAYWSDPMRRIRQRYIAIFHQLQSEPVGPRRSQLVQEAFRLKSPLSQD